jgi:hypothetical protein
MSLLLYNKRKLNKESRRRKGTAKYLTLSPFTALTAKIYQQAR